MLKHRIIPCLLLSNDGLVKTRQFSDPVYIGDPINAIRIFNEKEVDELMVLDIEASKNGKEPNYDLIEQFAEECFMPLCYGGGISKYEHAHRLFSLGVEKICLQSAVLDDPALISLIASQYGNQSVVVSADVKNDISGGYKLYSSSLSRTMDLPLQDYLKRCVDAGAGEVLLNSVDLDGMMTGMDLQLIHEVSTPLPVPLIAVGGAGSLQDMRMAVNAGASAVAAGAFFVFHGPYRAVLITYPEYGELEELFPFNKETTNRSGIY